MTCVLTPTLAAHALAAFGLTRAVPLVVPGHPEQSLFYTKLTATPPCGARMPFGGGALPDAQIEMVRSWIAAGALDD